ncbi:GTPase Era [Porticoccus sp. GXU_MW_L64]
MSEANAPQKCGFVAIVGRPNVGKSTLLNHLMGQKLSITSRKPQTTRHNLLGIKTENDSQLIFVDTPGMHTNQDKAINRYMNRAASSAVRDVDVVVVVLDRTTWTEADQAVIDQLHNVRSPIILALNKVDRVDDKKNMLPWLQSLEKDLQPAAIVPISALHGHNLGVLEREINKHIPEGDYYFPEDQITDRTERFLAAELVREKITRQLGAELPYQVAVEVEEFRRETSSKGKPVIHISALILVERDGQKKIIIGDKGDRIKKIGQQSRTDMEALFDEKVMLNLWVKVRSGWSDDERALHSLGFRDE